MKDFKEYLVRCPYCDSREISAGEFTDGDREIYCVVECATCRKAWREVYEYKFWEDF